MAAASCNSNPILDLLYNTSQQRRGSPEDLEAFKELVPGEGSARTGTARAAAGRALAGHTQRLTGPRTCKRPGRTRPLPSRQERADCPARALFPSGCPRRHAREPLPAWPCWPCWGWGRQRDKGATDSTRNKRSRRVRKFLHFISPYVFHAFVKGKEREGKARERKGTEGNGRERKGSSDMIGPPDLNAPVCSSCTRIAARRPPRPRRSCSHQ